MDAFLHPSKEKISILGAGSCLGSIVWIQYFICSLGGFTNMKRMKLLLTIALLGFLIICGYKKKDDIQNNVILLLALQNQNPGAFRFINLFDCSQ